jgi:hypothetical protein
LILQEEGANDSLSDDNNATIVDLGNITSESSPEEADNSTETLQLSTNTTSVNVTDVITLDGPPIPETDLTKLCSEESITQTAGLKKCIKACDLGSCCGATDENECLSTHAETCYLYTPCNNAYNLLYSD